MFQTAASHHYTAGHLSAMDKYSQREGQPLRYGVVGGIDELDGCDAGLRVTLQTGMTTTVDWTLFSPERKVIARGNERCGAAATCFKELRAKLPDEMDRYALAQASKPTPAPRQAVEVAEEAAPAPRPAPQIASDVDRPGYTSKPRPDDYAVVVGIEDYPNLPKAKHALRDAEAVRAHMKALGVPERNVIALTGAAATRGKLAAYLDEWLPKNVKPTSNVFFYYSGHGAPDAQSGQAYLVPADGDPMFLQSTAYPLKDLYAKLAKLPAKKVVVALDACFSGAGGRSVLADGARPLVVVKSALKPAGSVSVLAAASGDEITGALEEQGHGMFTYYFLKGLSSGKRSTGQLIDFIKPNVQDEARRQNRDQTPTLLGQDLAF